MFQTSFGLHSSVEISQNVCNLNAVLHAKIYGGFLYKTCKKIFTTFLINHFQIIYIFTLQLYLPITNKDNERGDTFVSLQNKMLYLFRSYISLGRPPM